MVMPGTIAMSYRLGCTLRPLRLRTRSHLGQVHIRAEFGGIALGISGTVFFGNPDAICVAVLCICRCRAYQEGNPLKPHIKQRLLLDRHIREREEPWGMVYNVFDSVRGITRFSCAAYMVFLCAHRNEETTTVVHCKHWDSATKSPMEWTSR